MKWASISTLLTLTLILLPAPVSAQEQLRQGLAEMAGKTKRYLALQGTTEIKVGTIEGPRNATTVPGILETFQSELIRAGLQLRDTARFSLKGTFRVTEAPNPANTAVKNVAIEFVLTLLDAFGKPLADLESTFQIQREREILQIVGVTAELPANASSRKRDRILREAIEKPTAPVEQTRVLAGPGSPFGLELLVDGKPVSVETREGQAYASVRRGQRYTVRLHNSSELEMAVRLTIDGLSFFQFAEARIPEGPRAGQPLYEWVLVPARGTAEVKGWFRNPTLSNQFEVMAYPESAAGQLRQTAGVGVVTAVFAASWTDEKPRDELAWDKSASDATGQGPPIKTSTEIVKRNVGLPRAAISIRYAEK